MPTDPTHAVLHDPRFMPHNTIRVVTGVCLRQGPEGTEILLGKRKGGGFDECWETPGGKVDPGETDDVALAREWKEELGVNVKVLPHRLFEGEFVSGNGTPYDMVAYGIDVTDWFTPALQGHVMPSHSELGWPPLPVALHLDRITPSLRPILRTLLQAEDRSLRHILPSGATVDFDHPEDTPIYASDLYLILGRQRRYGGIVDVTVLEHLALCVVLAEAEYGRGSAEAAYIALHDGHEALLPDVTRPMKRRWPGYRLLEDRWEAHVHRALGFEWPLPPDLAKRVKAIDDHAPAIEAEVWGATNPGHYSRYHGLPTVGEHLIGQEIRDVRRRLNDDARSLSLWREIIHPAITRYLGRDPFPTEPAHGF